MKWDRIREYFFSQLDQDKLLEEMSQGFFFLHGGKPCEEGEVCVSLHHKDGKGSTFHLDGETWIVIPKTMDKVEGIFWTDLHSWCSSQADFHRVCDLRDWKRGVVTSLAEAIKHTQPGLSNEVWLDVEGADWVGPFTPLQARAVGWMITNSILFGE